MAELESTPSEPHLGGIQQRSRITHELRQRFSAADSTPQLQDAVALGMAEHLRNCAEVGDSLSVVGGPDNTHYWYLDHPDFKDPSVSEKHLGFSYTSRRSHLALLPPHVLETVTPIESTLRPLLQFTSQPWIVGDDGSATLLDGEPKVVQIDPADFRLGNVSAGWSVLQLLSENSSDYPGSMVDRARELNGYAPLSIGTYTKDLAGFNYLERGLWINRPYGKLGGVILSGASGQGADSIISFVVEDQEVTLPDSEIAHLQVDHMFGSRMPAQGSATDALGIQIHGSDTFVLGTRFRALEFGHMDRIDIQTNPDTPSVGVFALYDTRGGAEKASLEKAKQMHAEGGRPITYILVTPNGSDGAVITSCIGFDNTKKVQVWHPSTENFKGLPRLDIEMLDIGTKEVTVGPQLLAQLTNAHLHRLHARGIDPSHPVSQYDMDKIFWYTMFGALPGRLENGST